MELFKPNIEKMETKKDITGLIKALMSDDGTIRSNAALALGRIRALQAIDVLILHLTDKEWYVRRDAAWALGKIGDNKAAGMLLKCLFDDIKEVRSRALSALDSMNWKPQNDTELAYYKIACGRFDDVVKLGESAISPLIEASMNKDKDLRLKALRALGKIKDPKAVERLVQGIGNLDDWNVSINGLAEIGSLAVAPLIEALKHKSSSIKDVAAIALGKIKDKKATEPLINALLNEKEAFARKTMVEALSNIGDTRATGAIIKFINDEYLSVRIEAVRALRKLRDSSAAEPLMRLLKDTNFDIRITVVLALGEMKNPISVSSLIEALSDETCQVRFGAATALDNIGWKPENKAEKIKYIYAKGQWDCIDELRVPVMSLLIEGLKEDNNDFRNRIVWHIGNLRYSGAVESLIPMLKIPDIQGTAIEALANIGDEKIACPLIELLADGDEPLKDNITNALTKIGTSSVEHLIDGLKHKNKDIRKYSAKALGKIKDTRAVEQLIQMLNDSEYQVRWEAILAIGNIGDKKAMAPLVQIVLHETDPGISSRAREALWKMKDPVLTDMFIMALNNNNIDIQTTAVWSLMGLKDPRAIEPLALLANDIKTNEKVRNDAKQAIEYIRKPK